MGYIEYDSNNSGGSWWLTDQDWQNLEAAGWDVQWFRNRDDNFFRTDKDGRWLGALASSATRSGLTLGQAIREWEQVTGKDSSALGCSCCGTPHSFYAYDDDGRMTGDSYSPDFPRYGSRYDGD